MGVKFLTIHAHFYQPPRQDPWIGTIQEKTPNKIYNTYNQLIVDECYGKLSIQEIKLLSDKLLNLYSFLNFNFGPTLLSYIEKNYPILYLTIQEADIISKNIYGFGNAIAQIYNHAIMPLIPLKYKRLYTKWGIESFKRTFKREPYGIWLSKCACDNETLEVLIEHNIKFTILSTHQIKTATNINTKNKIDKVVPGIYIWRSKINPSKTITIFVYDKELSDLSFKELDNTEKFYLRVKNSIHTYKGFNLITTNGENYGHHIKSGDEDLKRLIQKIIDKKEIQLTNLTYLYHNLKPNYEVEINENTSWSCSIGIRQKSECEKSSLTQNKYKKWKKTLFEVTQNIREISNDYFISTTISQVKDPLKMLENYITVYEEKNPHKTLSFIDENLRNANTQMNKTEILKLLDLEIKSSFSHISCNVSCNSFFDDASNIETMRNIQNLIFVYDRLKGSKFENRIKTQIDLLKKEQFNYHPNVKEIIDDIIINSNKMLEKFAAEISYLSSLNFHLILSSCEWKIKNKQKAENLFETSMINLNTFEHNILETKIINEKGNTILDVKNLTNKKNFIFTIEDFSQDTKKLIEILKSERPSEINKKRFLYKLSNSTINDDIIESYIILLKEKTAESLPYAYEIAKLIVNLSLNSKLFYELEKEIQQTPLSPIMWKIQLIKRRINDNKKNQT